MNTVDTTYDHDFVMTVNATCHSVSYPKPYVNGTAQYGCSVPLKVDTRDDVSILSKPTYVKTFQDPYLSYLQTSSVALTAFGGANIVSLGSISATVTVRGNTSTVKFIVTVNKSPNILSYEDSMKLKLVQQINTITSSPDKSSVIEKYPMVFSDELGSLPGIYTIKLDTNAKPVQQPPRPVPVHLKEAYKTELDNLEQQGVIRKVTEYTDWVNSIVLVKRNNNTIRVCLDPRELNKNISTSKHLMRRLDDITPDMAGAKYFTVADTKNGYWHVQLDDKSQKYTTFNTLWGKYCFKRLALGLTCAGDALQQRLDQVLSGLKRVTGIADDILVWDNTIAEHDTSLRQLLQRCKDVGIRLNRDKFQYKLNKVNFYGHVVTENGLQADASKIDAIVKMTPHVTSRSCRAF